MSKASELLKMINSKPQPSDDNESNKLLHSSNVTNDDGEKHVSKASRLIKTITHDILEDDDSDSYDNYDPNSTSDQDQTTTDLKMETIDIVEDNSDNTDDINNVSTSDTIDVEKVEVSEDSDKSAEIESDTKTTDTSTSNKNDNKEITESIDNNDNFKEASMNVTDDSILEPEKISNKESSDDTNKKDKTSKETVIESFDINGDIPWDKITFSDEDKTYIESIKGASRKNQIKALLSKGYISKDSDNKKYIIKA